jgi:hypothetical protein
LSQRIDKLLVCVDWSVGLSDMSSWVLCFAGATANAAESSVSHAPMTEASRRRACSLFRYHFAAEGFDTDSDAANVMKQGNGGALAEVKKANSHASD